MPVVNSIVMCNKYPSNKIPEGKVRKINNQGNFEKDR